MRSNKYQTQVTDRKDYDKGPAAIRLFSSLLTGLSLCVGLYVGRALTLAEISWSSEVSAQVSEAAKVALTREKRMAQEERIKENDQTPVYDLPEEFDSRSDDQIEIELDDTIEEIVILEDHAELNTAHNRRGSRGY